MKEIFTSTHACGEVSNHHAVCQEVGRFNNRDGSQGMYITFATANLNKTEPRLTFKPRGDVTQNKTYVCVRQNH